MNTSTKVVKPNTDIPQAIGILVSRIDDTVSHDEALKFTQAALNLAQVISILKNAEGTGKT